MRKFFGSLLEVVEVAVIAIAAVFLIRAFLVQPFLVSGDSMVPNFHNGDYLIIDELTYRLRAPERGEVIVFRYPKDVRGNKRDYIVERAKKLLEGLDSSDGDMAKSVREESRVARIGEYGEDKLPCGDISGNEVIVVEGRADVVNLIKNRIYNVVGMSGAKWSKDISILSEDKEITLFVDGDRGGKLIAKNVINNANVAFVAVAPDGKEVEELQSKEILMSLRKKWPVQDYVRRVLRNDSNDEVCIQ
jgi:signal peptidase I